MRAMTRRIQISDTTLSDSSHALRKAPLGSEELMPLAEAMDVAGFHAAEVWGGSTFDTCLRYLRENPWDRLRLFARKLKNTPLRIIVRGQNLLGYHPLPLDVIKAFAEEIAKNGIRRARIFDPLNDVGNLEHVIASFSAAGVECEGAIVYTQSPIHTIELFTQQAEQLVGMGCRTLCINDVAGMLSPSDARELAQALGAKAPVSLHTRSISGMGAMAYVAAVQAGAAGVDCTIGPFAVSSAQPTVEAMIQALADMNLETGIDPRLMRAYSKAAEQVAVRHAVGSEEDKISQSMISVHKIPIGMLSGLLNELNAIAAANRLSEVLAEVTRVREDFGWPPLTTPISQMVSSQAINNVLTGRRYEVMSREVRDYIKGMYGTPPGEMYPELLKNVPRVSGRASLLLPPQMEKLEEELKREGLYERHEDVITYALFGPVALSFFRHRRDPQSSTRVVAGLDARLDLLTSFMDRRGLRRLEVAGSDFRVKLVKRGTAPAAPAAAASAEGSSEEILPDESSEDAPKGNLQPIVSPLAGTFYRSPSPAEPPFVEIGAEVTEETVVGLVEAMKLFHEVKAERKGVIRTFAVQNAGMVEQGGALAYVEPPAE